MKRKVVIVIFVLLIFFIGLSICTAYKPSDSSIYYASVYDEKSLKELGITFNTTNIKPVIGRNEVRKIAKDLQSQYSVIPKNICLEYGLLTDINTSINVISKEAIDANPKLKDKKSITDIPAWIITFTGLLPDDYIQDTSVQGKQPLNMSSIVVDAMTGKVLYSFGTGM